MKERQERSLQQLFAKKEICIHHENLDHKQLSCMGPSKYDVLILKGGGRDQKIVKTMMMQRNREKW